MRPITLLVVLVGLGWFLSARASSRDPVSGGSGPRAERVVASSTDAQDATPFGAPGANDPVPRAATIEDPSASSAQGGRERDKPKPDAPARPVITRAAIAQLNEDIQGAWKLTSYEAPALEQRDRQEVGFLLVAGSYFSFEMHLGWTTTTGTVLERTFVSGTHRFEIDENSRIVANSVIGAGIDDDDKVAFEAPGRVRRYELTCTGNQMTLGREDGTKLTFERIADSRLKRDAYGRPLKTKDPNAPTDGDDKKKEPPR